MLSQNIAKIKALNILEEHYVRVLDREWTPQSGIRSKEFIFISHLFLTWDINREHLRHSKSRRSYRRKQLLSAVQPLKMWDALSL